MRQGLGSDAWPIVLLLCAVVLPAMGLTGFMAVAMRNERLAARQRLADAYQIQLAAIQARLQLHWQEKITELEQNTVGPPAAVFARCLQRGWIDSLVLLDAAGRLRYPNSPMAPKGEKEENSPQWQTAQHLEGQRRYHEAARQFKTMAEQATNHHVAARAFQAAARCFRQAGQSDEAVRLIAEAFSGDRHCQSVDLQGRMIAANCDLMALELITNRTDTMFARIAERLAGRVNDYDNAVLASPQRRFLMRELQALAAIEFPTLPAEDLAAKAVDQRTMLDSFLQRAAVPGYWQVVASNRQVVALIGSEKLLAATRAAIESEPIPSGVEVSLVAPTDNPPDAFVTSAAGASMPGWRLALSLKEHRLLEELAGRQAAAYLWTGLGVVALMAILTLLTLRFLRRRLTLARLRNDLAAAVSHELKTPLSSMRVLVDTLLDKENFDEQRTKEYLRLIASENERLGRLIQNFLTFSRLERSKQPFHLTPLQVNELITTAIDSMGDRLRAPGCHVEVELADSRLVVMGDADALMVALNNLLDNACKYSEGTKHIIIRAKAEAERVVISVEDHGIGISLRERKKIFQPFYQAERSETAKGCGLGLSIVRYVTLAHGGRVSVDSWPGRGSTFAISLPAMTTESAPGENAFAS